MIDGNTGGGGGDTDTWMDGDYIGVANRKSTIKAVIHKASATQAVTIHIKPGTYSEKISTSKRIHFVTWVSGSR